MYKPFMASSLQNQVWINTLNPKPDITVWVARIPDILDAVFCKGSYHNFKPVVNEIFQKQSFALPLLNQGEINTINGFKALKKQLEWICGRYLIKRMTQSIFFKDLPLDRISLGYLAEGAPFLTISPETPISLSHSNDYTAVACSTDPAQTIGLDIEKIAKKPDAWFLKTAFTPEEILHLADDAAHIFKHWTIKEAFLKYIKRGFNESLHRVEVIHNQILYNKKKMEVDIFSTDISPPVDTAGNDAIVDKTVYILSLVSD
jgi:4'-phosphopantetheinyl transferase